MALANVNSEDLFSHLLRAMPLGLERGSTTSEGTRWIRPIALDVKEKEQGFEILADVPGVDKRDIKLQVEGDVLNISVEKDAGNEETKEQDGVKWHRVERAHTYYRRSLRMPDAADMSKIKAKYENGVLCLDIPKAEKAKSHTVEIM
jgi:HSP20 family molecular chaperone IbpA